jgi:iron(III) transport system ATP-binding protein
MSVPITIDHVCKKFGGHTVIPDLTVKIKNGEFFTLLGPSGCGKTTLLRMIAGFNSIEAGQVSFGEQVINDVPTYQRNIGMVFQSYAIFPHLTVRKNVEYGLKIRKTPKMEMKTRVDEILKLVHIDEFQDCLPERLSGGQQQRVALARAIVIHPQVLLMDEPLSNLDAKLRIEMRAVIREIQNQVGITTVYVTHDQEEALAISDRIAVMNQGVIQQIGTPYTVYVRPVNVFVATFIGHSNLFWATVEKNEGAARVVFSSGYKMAMENMSDSVQDGQTVVVAIRPEEFEPASEGLPCQIVNRIFLGRYSNYFLKFDEAMCVPGQPSFEFSQDLGHAESLFAVGDTLTLRFNPQKINVFTQDMSMSLMKDAVTDEKA